MFVDHVVFIVIYRSLTLSPASISNSPLRFWLKKEVINRCTTPGIDGGFRGSEEGDSGQIVRQAPSLGNSNSHDFAFVPFISKLYYLEMHYFRIPQFPFSPTATNALF
jgi:hypothetical protein